MFLQVFCDLVEFRSRVHRWPRRTSTTSLTLCTRKLTLGAPRRAAAAPPDDPQQLTRDSTVRRRLRDKRVLRGVPTVRYTVRRLTRVRSSSSHVTIVVGRGVS